MPRFPSPTGAEMVRFLKTQGFEVIRIPGSHHFMHRVDLRTTVPVHAGRNLRIGTLCGILRDVELSPAESVNLWSNQ